MANLKFKVGVFGIKSSYAPGVGIAADNYLPGIVIDKALESYEEPEIGRIQILIMNI